MMRRAGRTLGERHENRDTGGAISPEQPSRREQSRRRRGLQATPGPGGECDKHSTTGQFFDKKRESLAAPTLAQKYTVGGDQLRRGERESCSVVRT